MSRLQSKRVQEYILKTADPLGSVEFDGHTFGFAGILNRTGIAIVDKSKVICSRLYYYKRKGEIGLRMTFTPTNEFQHTSKQFNLNEFADKWIHSAVCNAIFYSEKYPRATLRQLMNLDVIDSIDTAALLTHVTPLSNMPCLFDEELCNMFNAECYIEVCERRFRHV